MKPTQADNAKVIDKLKRAKAANQKADELKKAKTGSEALEIDRKTISPSVKWLSKCWKRREEKRRLKNPTSENKAMEAEDAKKNRIWTQVQSNSRIA